MRGKRIERVGRLSEEQADVQEHVLYGLRFANPVCLLSHVPDSILGPPPIEPAMKLHQNIQTNPDGIVQEIERESVLCHLVNGRYIGLDNVGTRMWRRVEEHGGLRSVFDRMRAEFDVDPRRLETDLGRLLGELADQGFVNLGGGVSGRNG